MVNVGVKRLEAAEMYNLWLKHRELMEFDQDWGFERSARQHYRIAMNFWRLYKDAKGELDGSQG